MGLGARSRHGGGKIHRFEWPPACAAPGWLHCFAIELGSEGRKASYASLWPFAVPETTCRFGAQ